MKPQWTSGRTGGRLTLPGGGTLSVKCPAGDVRWTRGALELSGTFPASGEHAGIALEIVHPVRAARHVFVPHLAPEDGFVMGDYVFRSPALILADAGRVFALIPDLDDLAAADGWRAWLDYDHPQRRVTLCAGAYDFEGHVFFKKKPVACRGQEVKLRLHVLASERAADLANPYGLVARWLWRRWGHPGHAAGGSQRAPLSRYMDHVVHWAFSAEGWGETVWQSMSIGAEHAGAPVFIVDVTRHPSVPPAERTWREPRSVWNQAWFSTQRCANGLFRHARAINSQDLAARARAMTQLALLAPQQDGLFPSVLRSIRSDGEDPWRDAQWANSDRRPRSASREACHLVDAAFTCRMLLEWFALTRDERVLGFVVRFADRLVRLQRPSGAFPGWVEPDGSVPEELAESAETAVGVRLLLELGSLPRADPRWWGAAMAGLRFLETVLADGRWEDFETYYSCAPWGAPESIGKRIPRNGVHKQNTLAIFWCAEALLEAWRVSGDRNDLRLSRRCADELSLYQAVWDPPFLPAPAHGGFGVMNADSEWNDARQSLFAPLYFDLYRATGDRELLERGTSALRASFSMLYCPENAALALAYERRFPFFGQESYGFMMENQGHSGGDPIGTFTIYTWGNGSALATAATILERYGAVYVDTQRKAAFGIDGSSAEVRGSRVFVRDSYDRTELRVAYADGSARNVKLRAGRGSVPLRPGALSRRLRTPR